MNQSHENERTVDRQIAHLEVVLVVCAVLHLVHHPVPVVLLVRDDTWTIGNVVYHHQWQAG